MEKSGGAEGLEKWMMESLPRTKKEDKKRLKKYGVEERQTKQTNGKNVGGGAGENGDEKNGTGEGGKTKNEKNNKNGSAKSRISSKSGYERQKENRRKAAVENSKRRKLEISGLED